MFRFPDAVAFRVEQLFDGAKMVCDYWVECVFICFGYNLFRQRIKRAWLKVPSACLGFIIGCYYLFRKRSSLPDIRGGWLPPAGLAGLDAFLFESAPESIITITPDSPIRRMAFNQTVKVIPYIFPELVNK